MKEAMITDKMLYIFNGTNDGYFRLKNQGMQFLF